MPMEGGGGGIERLRERLENSPGGCMPQEGLEDIPFSEEVRNVLGRGPPMSLGGLAVAAWQARANGGRRHSRAGLICSGGWVDTITVMS